MLPNESSESSRFFTIVRELNTSRLVPSLTFGSILGLMDVTVAVSFAVLIFGGEVSGLLSRGIGIMLFAAVVHTFVIGILSSVPGVFGTIQDIPAAILSLISTAIVFNMPLAASIESTFLTVVTAIALTTIATGLFFIMLGLLRSGGLVRYLPYPVIGGFLAGTGLLLSMGSLSVMVGQLPGLADIGVLFEADSLTKWFPGFIFAITLLTLPKRLKHPLVMPVMILSGVAVFYLTVWLSGSTVHQVLSSGWLVGPFDDEVVFQSFFSFDLGQIHWPVIADQAGNIATIVMISAVSLLLNASGIELVMRRDMDLNRELVIAGVANLGTAVGGGMVGFHGISYSVLGQKLGASNRLTGIVASLVCALALFVGAEALSFLPKFIVGGLLLYLGLEFMTEWVYQAWKKLPRTDYAVVILILVVIVLVGFLEAVLLGLILTIILFVLNYSRTSVIKHAVSGKEFKSRVTREEDQQQRLKDLGESIYILQLQGYIFFGTANSLFEKVRSRTLTPNISAPKFLVFDFRQVTGIDTTAMLSFTRMRQLAHEKGIALVLADMSPQVKSIFEIEGFTNSEGDQVHSFDDADHALEWCEDQLLTDTELKDVPSQSGVEDHLEHLARKGIDVKSLKPYLTRQQLEEDDFLIRQGEPPEDLFFIEEGQVTAWLETTERQSIRLETISRGHVLGEIGFYLGKERTASVIADKPSVVYRLTKKQLRIMEQVDPDTALALQEYIIELLSERVAHLMNAVNALQH